MQDAALFNPAKLPDDSMGRRFSRRLTSVSTTSLKFKKEPDDPYARSTTEVSHFKPNRGVFAARVPRAWCVQIAQAGFVSKLRRGSRIVPAAVGMTMYTNAPDPQAEHTPWYGSPGRPPVGSYTTVAGWDALRLPSALPPAPLRCLEVCVRRTLH